MRFKGLDLNLLLTLEILLVEGHLTRASNRLRLTQPAVSNALTKLREHFGDPLLVRHGRDMRLSPFAERLLKPLQDTLQRINEVAGARPSFEPSTADRVYKIVASDYITTVLIGILMLRLRTSAPHVKIQQLYLNDESIGKFSRGDADAFIQLDRDLALPTLPKRTLFSESFICIAAVSNRLVGQSLSPEEYHAHPRIVPPYSRYYPDLYMAYTGAKSSAIPVPFPSMPLYVSQTDHVAIVPERLAELFEPILPIRRVRLTSPIPQVHFVLQCHTAALADPFNSWMLDEIEAASQRRYFRSALRPVPATKAALQPSAGRGR